MSTVCWTCGENTSGFTFRCVQCEHLMLLQGIDNSISIVGGQVDSQLRAIAQASSSTSSLLTEITGDVDQLLHANAIGNMLEVAQLTALRELSRKLPEAIGRIESTIRWGCEQVVWRIEKQSDIMRGIDESLKTPAQTKANEWRIMADTLRERGVLNESRSFYEKSLTENPLDFRTYVGLASVHIQACDIEHALSVLSKSLPHAPQGTSGEIANWRSHSLRTMAHIYHCIGNHDRELDLLRDAVKSSPEYRACLYDHAVAAMECNSHEESLTSLSTLLHSSDIQKSEKYFELTRRQKTFIQHSSKVKPILRKALMYWAHHLVHSPICEMDERVSQKKRELFFYLETLPAAVRKEAKPRVEDFLSGVTQGIRTIRSQSDSGLDSIARISRVAASVYELRKDFLALEDREARIKRDIKATIELREQDSHVNSLLFIVATVAIFLMTGVLYKSLAM